MRNQRIVQHVNAMERQIRKTVHSISVPAGKASFISNYVITDLAKVIESRGYHGILSLYGSYFSGLCCEDSDIDIIFEFRKRNSRTVPKNIPSSIEKILKRFPYVFSQVKLISNTRVPFIKFIHNGSRKECNITFENRVGVQNSKLIKLYLTMNPNLKPLTLYLKHLLNKYGIRGIGGITTHILFWMVVFFMQQKGLLPPVREVRVACSSQYVFSRTNCAAPDSFSYNSSNRSLVSLCSLVLDFTSFFRDFKFMKYVMSPHFGKAYPIDQMENSRSFIMSFINLQHPSNFGMNLARQINKPAVNDFRILCCHVSKILPHFMKFSKDCNRTFDDILPEMLPYTINQPNELIQCTSFQIRVDISKRLIGCVIRTVRQLMENILHFKATKIIKKDVLAVINGVGKTYVPTIFFSFASTSITWNNNIISRIIPCPKFNKYGEPDRQINIFFACEVIIEKKIVKIMVESEAHLMPFLDEYARSLLSSILETIV